MTSQKSKEKFELFADGKNCFLRIRDDSPQLAFSQGHISYSFKNFIVESASMSYTEDYADSYGSLGSRSVNSSCIVGVPTAKLELTLVSDDYMVKTGKDNIDEFEVVILKKFEQSYYERLGGKNGK